MDLKTKYSCGDKVWAWVGDYAQLITIGQVRVEYTDSAGLNDGYVDPGIPVPFDNYKPQASHEERYMCIETGIGSGSLWTVDRMFDSREACEAANKAEIELRQRVKEAEERRRSEELLRQETRLRGQLDEIERIKARAALAL